MAKNPEETPCPVLLTLGLIANKWSIRIIHNLLSAPAYMLRFGELKNALGAITQRELTKHLREFEKVGIVSRKVYAEVPPRTEYTLTNLGLSLCEPIEALSKWAEKYGATIQENSKQYLKEVL